MSTVPHVRWEPVMATGASAAREVNYQVTRRYVEIRDAVLTLGLPA